MKLTILNACFPFTSLSLNFCKGFLCFSFIITLLWDHSMKGSSFMRWHCCTYTALFLVHKQTHSAGVETVCPQGFDHSPAANYSFADRSECQQQKHISNSAENNKSLTIFGKAATFFLNDITQFILAFQIKMFYPHTHTSLWPVCQLQCYWWTLQTREWLDNTRP